MIRATVCELMWKKYCRAWQATDDNIIRRMRVTCRISKARIHAHILQHLLLFHGNSSYANALQCYVIRSLPVSFNTDLFMLSDYGAEIIYFIKLGYTVQTIAARLHGTAYCC